MKEKFIIEEYKSKWDYLKHLENKQVELLKWYTIIVGAIFAYLTSSLTTLNEIVGNTKWKILLFFLSILSLVVSIYLVIQKKNYKIYNKRINDIEKENCNFKLIKKKCKFIGSFTILYSVFLIFGSGIVGLLRYTYSDNYHAMFYFSFIYFFIMLLLSFIILKEKPNSK